MSKKRPGALNQFFQGFNLGTAKLIKGVGDLNYLVSGKDAPPVKVSQNKKKEKREPEQRVRIEEPTKDQKREQLQAQPQPPAQPPAQPSQAKPQVPSQPSQAQPSQAQPSQGIQPCTIPQITDFFKSGKKPEPDCNLQSYFNILNSDLELLRQENQNLKTTATQEDRNNSNSGEIKRKDKEIKDLKAEIKHLQTMIERSMIERLDNSNKEKSTVNPPSLTNKEDPYSALESTINGKQNEIQPKIEIQQPLVQFRQDALGNYGTFEEFIENRNAQVAQSKPLTQKKKSKKEELPKIDSLTLVNLEKVLNDSTKGLESFNEYLSIDKSKKVKLNANDPRPIYTIKGDDNRDLVLKELPDENNNNDLDISPLVSKYLADKGEYPERLVKYFGNNFYKKNLSKRFSGGDLTACTKSGNCVINNQNLTNHKQRISFLAKNYKELIKSLNELHKFGIAHVDIKSDNIFLEGDNMYIGDYDKSCRTRDLKSKNRNISKEINKIIKCEDKKDKVPFAYMPYVFYEDKDGYNPKDGYKPNYDFYELAITLYEIIKNAPNNYLSIDEISTAQRNNKLKELFVAKYTDLKTFLLAWMPHVDREEMELLKFIIAYAYPFSCNRTSTDFNPNCYETVNKHTGENSIIPSYCDRIVYNYNEGYIKNIEPLEYGSLYINDTDFQSDHNIVFAKMKINFKEIVGVQIKRSLSLIYFTLNQGSGLGDSESADMNPILEKCENQDIIVFGLQEIQNNKDFFINNFYNKSKDYEKIYSDIYGASKRKVGLFVFVKKTTPIQIQQTFKTTTPIQQCLVVRPLGLFCNKSMVGVTLNINISDDKDKKEWIYINLYSAHLSFSQKDKNFLLSDREQQLQSIIKTIQEISKIQETNYINIIGGDLNFRNSDYNKDPESIVTDSMNIYLGEEKENFTEPFVDQKNKRYTFPPTCKYKTGGPNVMKKKREVAVNLKDVSVEIPQTNYTMISQAPHQP